MIGLWLLWIFVLAVLAWQTRHALRWPLERDRIIAAARARTGLAAPAEDVEPGTDLAQHDECELIWSMPAFDDAGYDRLRQALREHREEDQT